MTIRSEDSKRAYQVGGVVGGPARPNPRVRFFGDFADLDAVPGEYFGLPVGPADEQVLSLREVADATGIERQRSVLSDLQNG